MAAKIKKGDNVMIMAGKDRGKTGKVLEILASKKRVRVEGRNIVMKHRKSGQNQEGGIHEMEAPLHLSNVMIVDPSDGKPCRVGFDHQDDKKRRISRRTGTSLD